VFAVQVGHNRFAQLINISREINAKTAISIIASDTMGMAAIIKHTPAAFGDEEKTIKIFEELQVASDELFDELEQMDAPPAEAFAKILEAAAEYLRKGSDPDDEFEEARSG
tara:strand:+ start:165 stop:497 length:333 start_codon:yes stop_codon:yes gene_type:complete